MTATTELIRREPQADELSVEQIVSQTLKIQQCMDKVMKKDQHYGVIPGTNTKPTLLKPGAEKLCLLFRLDPEYDVINTVETPERISYMVRCTVFHIPTGSRVASGLGSCNSREEKYLRAANKKCPQCGKETVLRSRPRNKKEEENPDALGWFCWGKKGGCGKNFTADDPGITQQDTGLKDPADLANTILKMACKRALIAAVLNGTAASDFFTQDLEDLTEKAAEYIPPPAKEGSGPKADTGVTPATATTSTKPKTPAGQTTTQTAGSTSAPTSNTKPPRANTVKHDGTFASHRQVAYLHMLKQKVGGLVFCPDNKSCYVDVGDGLQQVVAQLCAYHKQLAAFKDVDGRPIKTSTNLSEDQASNLIDRYEAKIKQQEARADEQPDLAAAFDQAEENARIRGELGPGSDG